MLHHREWSGAPFARHLLQARVQELRPRMRFIRTRPLNAAERVESSVAHAAGKIRRYGSQLVPHFLCSRCVPVVPQSARDFRDDPELIARTLGWLLRLSAPL